MEEKENAVIIDGKKFRVQKMDGLGKCSCCDLGDEYPSCDDLCFWGEFCFAFENYFEYKGSGCYVYFKEVKE